MSLTTSYKALKISTVIELCLFAFPRHHFTFKNWQQSALEIDTEL